MSSLEETQAKTKRADTLVAWQASCEERINKLLVIILAVTLFYLYYGLVSPVVAESRLNRTRTARADLDPIIEQFEVLRARYINFVSPPMNAPAQSGSDISLFRDKIIPALRARPDTRDAPESELLDAIDRDMATLSQLFQLHLKAHPTFADPAADYSRDQLRRQLRTFRRSLGVILSTAAGAEPSATEEKGVAATEEADDVQDQQAALNLRRLLGGGAMHLDVDDDPVNRLSLLLSLEKVIRDLKGLENNESGEDRLLADKAREALTPPPGLPGVQIGDTLTRNFPAYQGLAEYTDLNGPDKILRYSGGTDIGSYGAIKMLLNPPFDVATISDLRRLKTFADAEIDRRSAEMRAPTLVIPFINASIDRDIILAATPMLLVVLVHLLGLYVARSRRLTAEIAGDETNKLDRADYLLLAPFSLMGPAAELSRPAKGTNLVADAAERLRGVVKFFVSKVFPMLVPLSVSLTLLHDLLFTQRTSGLVTVFLWFVFPLSSAFLFAESYLIVSALDEGAGSREAEEGAPPSPN